MLVADKNKKNCQDEKSVNRCCIRVLDRSCDFEHFGINTVQCVKSCLTQSTFFLDSRLSRVQLQPQLLKWPYSVQSVWHQAIESSLNSCSVPSPLEVSNVCWKDALYDGVLIIFPCTSPSLISLKCCFCFCQLIDVSTMTGGSVWSVFIILQQKHQNEHVWQMMSHFNPIYSFLSQHWFFFFL